VKKVLMICPSYPPEGGGGTTRILKFSKYLVQSHWKSVIVTMQDNASGIYAPDLLVEVPGSVEVHHTKKIILSPKDQRKTKFLLCSMSNRVVDKMFAPLLIPDRYITRMPLTAILSIYLIWKRKVSVVISSSPCHSIQVAGLFVWFFSRKPWIVDFRDGWLENLYFKPKDKIKYIIEKRIEAMCLQQCNKILVTTDAHKDKVISIFPFVLPQKIAVIPNGYDPEEFDNISKKNQSKLIMSYLGSVGYKRIPIVFLKSLKAALIENVALQDDLVINFYGATSISLKSYIDSLELNGSVFLNPQVSRRDAIAIMINSEILLSFLTENRGADHTISGKIFEYLKAKRFILSFCSEGPESKLIRNMKAGVPVITKDVSEAKDIILKLYSRWKSRKLKVNSDDSLIEAFDRKKLTQKLSNILDSLDG
jgi:glycosyltransferase involved in cell wall biosynthesis